MKVDGDDTKWFESVERDEWSPQVGAEVADARLTPPIRRRASMRAGWARTA